MLKSSSTIPTTSLVFGLASVVLMWSAALVLGLPWYFAVVALSLSAVLGVASHRSLQRTYLKPAEGLRITDEDVETIEDTVITSR